VQALASEEGARLQRVFHPLRWQRWAVSDLNPCMWWLAPAAQAAKAQRQAVAADHPARRAEASCPRSRARRSTAGARCAMRRPKRASSRSTATSMRTASGTSPQAPRTRAPVDSALIEDVLARIGQGGYAEALARVAFLMAHDDEPLPLSRVRLARDLLEDYRELLPELSPAEVRRIGGAQEVIARHEPDKAVETLPALLSGPETANAC
jgi:hypothetical protein